MGSALGAGTCTLRAIFRLWNAQGAIVGAFYGKKIGFRYPTPPFPFPTWVYPREGVPDLE